MNEQLVAAAASVGLGLEDFLHAFWYASHEGRLLEYVESVAGEVPTEDYRDVCPPLWLSAEQAARTLPVN